MPWYPSNAKYPSLGFSPYPAILEGQCLEVGDMTMEAFNVGGIRATHYEVVSGEWPPGLTIDNGGNVIGVVSDNRVTSPAKAGKKPKSYNQTNYLENAIPGIEIEFTVKAYGPQLSATYQTFTMYIKTNWCARRNDFILNIENEYPKTGTPKGATPVGEGYTFSLGGKAVDNQTYFDTMRKDGYFQGEVC